MRCFRALAGGAFFLLLAGSLRAETPSDPLRLIPDVADVVVRVDNPRRLVEAYTNLDILKQLTKFDAIQELLDSTSTRRFYQLVAYYEKQLGARWPELVDRLGGGGAALGVKLGPNPAPTLLVLQSKDEELLRKFVKLAMEVAEQELARQDSKERFARGKYRDIETVRIGDLHGAVAGSALLISNNETALQRGLDLHFDGGKSLAGSASLAEARKLLPPDPLAWAWLNMDVVRMAPQAKEVFALPRNDVNLTVLFGGWLDVAGRAPFLCGALCKEEKGFLATIRMPRGREGSAEAITTHIPPANAPGAPPLLEPKGVIYSESSYFDLGKFWENREKLFNAKQIKAFEDFNKTTAPFLAGNKFSDMTAQLGPYHRFVVAHQPKTAYKVEPNTRLPSFGLVLDMRQPEKLGKSLETILRGAALLAGARFKVKLVEEKHGERTIISYRFPEDPKDLPGQNTIAYNFTPCFVTVGDQFVMASTLDLCRELIDILDKEAKNPPARDALNSRTKVYASGGADLLQAVEDQLFAQTILERAIPPAEAKQQVKEFIGLVRRLGGIGLDSAYGAKDFRYDIRLQLSK